MIDADEFLKLKEKEPSEAYKEFYSNKNIIPVTDNLIKYKGVIYELEPIDMRAFADFRTKLGYELDYGGIEKFPGDAGDINGLYAAAVFSIVETIEHENQNKFIGETRHKIISKDTK